MCGRYVSATPPDELARYFGAAPADREELIEPNYNVAPTDDVYVVFEREHERHLDVFTWGLVPRWAKDPKIGSRMINARADGLADKNAFRFAFERKRCIVPADGFYEWKKTGGAGAASARKQPIYIHRADGAPMALAGLWESWRADPDAPVLRTCTIITTTPNDKMAAIHDRMPVVLEQEWWASWLDEDNRDLDALGALLVPVADDAMELHPVSNEVNKVTNDGPQLIAPVEPEPVAVHDQLSLLEAE
jgi:putative SOS response-associated peptidase YedK